MQIIEYIIINHFTCYSNKMYIVQSELLLSVKNRKLLFIIPIAIGAKAPGPRNLFFRKLTRHH